jgi:Glycosyl transferase family 2
VDAGELDGGGDRASASDARVGLAGGHVSIALEWDNIRLSEADRSRRLLAQLDAQAGDIGAQVDVIVCYNDDEVDGHELEHLLQRHLTIPWKLAAARGCEYYELKNRAASLSKGDPVVFVDSDVIPEPEWLAELLACFDDPAVEVACGSTFIDPESLSGKAFALFWFFPLRQVRREISQVPLFYANNVAFRRRTFERFPFPHIVDASRGSCLLLAERLRTAGIAIWRNSAARASHPPPSGLAHFVTRAVAQGRDRYLRERSGPRGWLDATAGSAVRFARHLARSARDIASGYRETGVAMWQLPVIALIAAAYYGLFFCGELAAALCREWMTRHFRI